MKGNKRTKHKMENKDGPLVDDLLGIWPEDGADALFTTSNENGSAGSGGSSSNKPNVLSAGSDGNSSSKPDVSPATGVGIEGFDATGLLAGVGTVGFSTTGLFAGV